MTTHTDDGYEDEDSLFERFHDRLVGRPREFGNGADGAGDTNGADGPRELVHVTRDADGASGADGDRVRTDGASRAATDGADDASPAGSVRATARRSTETGEASGLAEMLAAELAAGEVDDATRRALAEALRVGLDTPTQVRLDGLSARVAELDAYTDALETVLERVGTDDDVVARFERLTAEMDGVERAAREDRTRVRSDLDGLRGDLNALRAEVEELREWKRHLTGAFATDGGSEATATDGRADAGDGESRGTGRE